MAVGIGHRAVVSFATAKAAAHVVSGMWWDGRMLDVELIRVELRMTGLLWELTAEERDGRRTRGHIRGHVGRSAVCRLVNKRGCVSSW